jgi:hypothetical protein
MVISWANCGIKSRHWWRRKTTCKYGYRLSFMGLVLGPTSTASCVVAGLEWITHHSSLITDAQHDWDTLPTLIFKSFDSPASITITDTTFNCPSQLSIWHLFLFYISSHSLGPTINQFTHLISGPHVLQIIFTNIYPK